MAAAIVVVTAVPVVTVPVVSDRQMPARDNRHARFLSNKPRTRSYEISISSDTEGEKKKTVGVGYFQTSFFNPSSSNEFLLVSGMSIDVQSQYDTVAALSKVSLDPARQRAKPLTAVLFLDLFRSV